MISKILYVCLLQLLLVFLLHQLTSTWTRELDDTSNRVSMIRAPIARERQIVKVIERIADVTLKPSSIENLLNATKTYHEEYDLFIVNRILSPYDICLINSTMKPEMIVVDQLPTVEPLQVITMLNSTNIIAIVLSDQIDLFEVCIKLESTLL